MRLLLLLAAAATSFAQTDIGTITITASRNVAAVPDRVVYYVTLRTSNEISLRKVVNGVVTELDRDPVPLQVGTPYRLRVEAIGTKLIVYLNDQVRLEASDSSHAQGRAGYVTFRAAASFSGYSAWQP